MRIYKTITVLVLTLTSVVSAAPDPTGLQAADPYGLTALHEGRAMRDSSSAVDWANSNGDARGIAPGETLVLAELEGPGVIRHIWNTINSQEYGASRNLVIRMYWDGEESPSVLSPLGDFFAVGHGMNIDVNSQPVRVTAEGLARNCYWPMPFEKSARITVTNEGLKPTIAFYWYVDWTQLPSLPENTPRFHAMYRQEYPCVPDRRYVVADIQGAGHYVGTVLNCRQHERGWMGEGDDFFFIDGEEEPSLKGTGTEDYFSDAWGFRENTGPYYGVRVYEGVEIQDRTSVYRWHLADLMPFKESLRLEIEHWGWWWIKDDEGKEIITAGERADDWSSVAFWYQTGIHKPYEPLPPAKDRHYYDWSKALEAETLREQAKVTVGSVDNWGRGGTSGGLYLHWGLDQVGQSLTLPVQVEEAGSYRVVMALLGFPYSGMFSFELDGVPLGRHLDLYHAAGSTREYALPATQLDVGDHTLVIRSVFKNIKSINYSFDLDAILLVPEGE
jgi:hypothetical protein